MHQIHVDTVDFLEGKKNSHQNLHRHGPGQPVVGKPALSRGLVLGSLQRSLQHQLFRGSVMSNTRKKSLHAALQSHCRH